MEQEKLAEASGLSLYIVRDEDAQSPDEFGDESLFLVADHRDFYVKPPESSTFETVVGDYEKTHHVFGLEAYIHSGVSLALSNEGSFPDRQWDVSRLGAVFVSKKEWPKHEDAKKTAEGYIETWNTYLSGDVWGYVPEDEEGEHIDSCWGYYGHEHAEEAGREALEYSAKQHEKERKAMLTNKDNTRKTLGELLSHEDATIKRHAIGILKSLK